MNFTKTLIPLLCLVVIVLINACKKSSSDGGAAGTLSVSRAAIDLDTTAGFTDTLTIHSTLSWKATLSSGASWCKLSKANGDAGDAALTITILSNNGTATAQTAVITFTATNGQASPVTVTLTQKAFPIISQLVGGSKWDFAYDVKKTSDGGMIIVGSTQSADGDLTNNQGSEDIMVAKLDASGNKQWVKTFGGSASDYANAVTPTTDGGYMVAGITSSSNGDMPANLGGGDIVVIKLDNSGNKLWVKTFGGSKIDEATSIIATPDGGYVLAGRTVSTDGEGTGNHGDSDIMIIKLDASGNKQWAKVLGGTTNDLCGHLIATADGGYALCGYSTSANGDISINKGSFDYLLMKLDASGNKVWDKTFGGSDTDYGYDLRVTTDGGYVITGYTESSDGDVNNYHGNTDIWVVKTDVSGDKQWTKTIGGSKQDYSYCLTATPDGGCIIGGMSTSTDGDLTGNRGTIDLLAIKINAAGNSQTIRTYGGSYDDEPLAMIEFTSGRYVFAGTSASSNGNVGNNHGGYDAWVLNLPF
ncbi:Putative binding domain-containing protein, N-terminal [Chitinophaga filiformis]|uniref:Putative binding domain-containing protein, N-terminal n=1 Tax=Chitinophaga filiformis TaxID=104663 RepID=A0A1G7TVM0_CHIFI|nr:Putative binding domain-containing protein, N-terminal [Chitinophaga filiformis]